jgi:hypothetical protein
MQKKDDKLANRIESMHQRLATRTAIVRRRAYQAAIDKKVAADAADKAAESAREPDDSAKPASDR